MICRSWSTCSLPALSSANGSTAPVGCPAVLWELLAAGRLAGGEMTVTGRTMADNLAGREASDREVILPFAAPLRERAGFLVLKGNLFDFAIMKTSAISDAFRCRYLSDGRQAVEARAIVFDGSDDYHHHINDPALAIDENYIRGGSVCLNSLAGLLSGLRAVDHAAARSGWWKYTSSGVRHPRLECGRPLL